MKKDRKKKVTSTCLEKELKEDGKEDGKEKAKEKEKQKGLKATVTTVDNMAIPCTGAR